jgi:hypothetical protein
VLRHYTGRSRLLVGKLGMLVDVAAPCNHLLLDRGGAVANVCFYRSIIATTNSTRMNDD